MASEEAYYKIAINIDKMAELSCENDKLLWNEAIEQAAKIVEDIEGSDYWARRIMELKK